MHKSSNHPHSFQDQGMEQKPANLQEGLAVAAILPLLSGSCTTEGEKTLPAITLDSPTLPLSVEPIPSLDLVACVKMFLLARGETRGCPIPTLPSLSSDPKIFFFATSVDEGIASIAPLETKQWRHLHDPTEHKNIREDEAVGSWILISFEMTSTGSHRQSPGKQFPLLAPEQNHLVLQKMLLLPARGNQ
nr:hypothetical protein Iba_chr04bCG8150 [Ipomoea batatas]